MCLHTNRRNEPEGHVHFIMFCAQHTGNHPLSNYRILPEVGLHTHKRGRWILQPPKELHTVGSGNGSTSNGSSSSSSSSSSKPAATATAFVWNPESTAFALHSCGTHIHVDSGKRDPRMSEKSLCRVSWLSFRVRTVSTYQSAA